MFVREYVMKEEEANDGSTDDEVNVFDRPRGEELIADLRTKTGVCVCVCRVLEAQGNDE